MKIAGNLGRSEAQVCTERVQSHFVMYSYTVIATALTAT